MKFDDSINIKDLEQQLEREKAKRKKEERALLLLQQIANERAKRMEIERKQNELRKQIADEQFEDDFKVKSEKHLPLVVGKSQDRGYKVKVRITAQDGGKSKYVKSTFRGVFGQRGSSTGNISWYAKRGPAVKKMDQIVCRSELEAARKSDELALRLYGTAKCLNGGLLNFPEAILKMETV